MRKKRGDCAEKAMDVIGAHLASLYAQAELDSKLPKRRRYVACLVCFFCLLGKKFGAKSLGKVWWGESLGSGLDF